MSPPTAMKAMVLERQHQPLQWRELPIPALAREQVLLQVDACAVCRTDLHVVDGELPHPKLPLIPGHEIVGWVIARGADVSIPIGTRLGVPWLGWACGVCSYCRSGRENLCDRALFTGYQLDGGYATHTVADSRFCFPVPDAYDDPHAAPLFCAGLIGLRALNMAGDARTLGFYGFGASAHILLQIAQYQGRRVYAFTRTGDAEAQTFAKSLGAHWAGDSTEPPPEPLDAALIFAPVGSLVVQALRAIRKGGVVVCAGIHMTDIPSFPYELLWGERQIRSVANLTRADAREFFEIAPKVPVRTEVTVFSLNQANEALTALRSGELIGAAVLMMKS